MHLPLYLPLCFPVEAADADKAMGAFSFINMIMYAVFAIILAVHRGTMIASTVADSVTDNHR